TKEPAMRAAVTSERKLAANRRNARASTWPRTVAGKARVARNARRHGLTVPIAADPALAQEVEVLAGRLRSRQRAPRRLRPCRNGSAERWNPPSRSDKTKPPRRAHPARAV